MQSGDFGIPDVIQLPKRPILSLLGNKPGNSNKKPPVQ